jgi:hypothetical protein
MLVRYSAIVSFVSLLLGFFALLFIGWSVAGVVPFLGPDEQHWLLVYSAAVAAVLVPVWLIHWRWARQNWAWDSPLAQRYLVFFSAMGLGASVVVGVQLLARVINLVSGTGATWSESQDFLLGGGWSVVLSLFVCWYHGREWMTQRHKGAAAATPT